MKKLDSVEEYNQFIEDQFKIADEQINNAEHRILLYWSYLVIKLLISMIKMKY